MQEQIKLQGHAPSALNVFARVSKWLDQENRIGPVMVLPAVLIIILLIAYPFGKALWLSVTDSRIAQADTGNYIGLENFRSLMDDAVFTEKVIENTLKYTFGAVVLKLLLGMILALALNRPMPFRNYVAGMLLLPWVVPAALSVLAWKWIFDSNFSVLNDILEWAAIPGIGHDYVWLGKPDLAMFSVIAVNVWRGIPFFAVTMLAALQVVPKELLEAAEIDGANVWQRFWKVTLPTIFPVVVVTTLFSLVRTLADMEIIWILTTGGQPFNSTHVLATYSYQQAIQNTNLGLGAAASLFLFPAFLVIVFLQLRYLQKRDF